ncbi:F-box protein CPR1-like [Cornus florida]|uniref:F-box protein CPR1-like n=1 Tax=Cornus florida TaxID=4283 RepID=UPI00289B7971|nr:F-box protein CPR1-like [Cornus florida]
MTFHLKKMSEFPPRDVLIDILARLPIKCLVQCTTVCKSWYSLITSPIFITIHLNRSDVMNKDNKLFLVRRCSSDQNEEHYSLHYDNQMFDEYAKVRFPLKSYANYNFRIISSCNGVICLSYDQFFITNDLYLWNPSIQKLMALPPVRVRLQSRGSFMHNIGFGFDPLTNDYKVIRIVFSNPGEIPPEVDIFTLSTGTWRDIRHLCLPYIIEDRAPLAYVNGAAHWIASDRRGVLRGRLIVSFHIGDEVFREIMLPGSMAIDVSYPLSLRVAKFQESLCLIEMQLSGHFGNIGKYYCVWMMKEYGVATSWTKQFNIDMGKILESAVLTSNGFLVSSDPESKKLRDLEIYGSTYSWHKDQFYAYTESLVLLGLKPPVLRGKEIEADEKTKEERE